jgi:hypothetical protein
MYEVFKRGSCSSSNNEVAQKILVVMSFFSILGDAISQTPLMNLVKVHLFRGISRYASEVAVDRIPNISQWLTSKSVVIIRRNRC